VKSEWSNTQTIAIDANDSSASNALPSSSPSTPPDSSSPPSHDAESTPDQSINQTDQTGTKLASEVASYMIVVGILVVFGAILGLFVHVKKRGCEAGHT